MKVIDNFLPTEKFGPLQEMFLSKSFPWYWGSEKVLGAPSFYNYQLCHTFYENNVTMSNWDIRSVIETLKPNAIHRIKANLTLYTPEIYEYGLHTDVKEFECNTAVYYLNTNDGYTIFEDGAKVESVANRIVIFPSRMRHTGTTCTNAKRRIVLNLNFF